MQGTNVLFGQIAVVFGIVIAGVWSATQWTAAALGYQLRLGSPWFDFFGTPVYHPWRLFEWWFVFDGPGWYPTPAQTWWQPDERCWTRAAGRSLNAPASRAATYRPTVWCETPASSPASRNDPVKSNASTMFMISSADFTVVPPGGGRRISTATAPQEEPQPPDAAMQRTRVGQIP